MTMIIDVGEAEMPSVFEVKSVQAQKPHRCCECREAIGAGTRYERSRGCWLGSWGTYATCKRCALAREMCQLFALYVLRDLPEEGPAFGDLREWALECGLLDRVVDAREAVNRGEQP